ncbi:iron transporter [Actinomyces wuliandei]|uniref:iron transporter n=1 Tax=Actinomyces wuliandei TaxID=2057743 RepID=UPI000FDC85D5|nr:iron transporter [Actinomyces wuliandei]
MRSLTITSAVSALVLAGALGLAACSSGGSDDASSGTAASDSAADSGGDSGAGFEEFPVGEDQEAEDQINVAVVYFQPIDMEPADSGLAASDADLHLEADISALDGNTLGYGAGDFIPGLTVEYAITDKASGEEATSGTFMAMNASDGPHYGGNIALPDAGEYELTLTIDSPEGQGWVLHVDDETGVEGRFWTEPIELTWDWDYTPQEW